jgi:hypothetical protein
VLELTESQKGAIDKFVCKRVEETSNKDGLTIEDSLEQSNKNLNDDNPFNDNDNFLDGSNVNVGIDDHFITHVDIYDSRN